MFKFILSVYVFLYRLTKGGFGGNVQGLPVLLLTTVGRKTGKERIRPLGYFEHDGKYVITASNAGSDHNPAWYYNLNAHPQVGVQIGEKQLTATAQQVDSDLRAQLWTELVRRSPGYGNYEKRTKRVIPMVLLKEEVR